MRRNQDVPAKYFPVALHHRGVSKPLSHYSLSAFNSFSRFGLESRQQNIPIKKYTSNELEITRDTFLGKINPFCRSAKQVGHFFDSEKLGVHSNSYFPNLLFYFTSQHTKEPPHTKTINFSTKRI